MSNVERAARSIELASQNIDDSERGRVDGKG